MASVPDVLFAIFNCPPTHTIRVKDGEIRAIGDAYSPEQLRMDLVNGKWINSFGVVCGNLVFP